MSTCCTVIVALWLAVPLAFLAGPAGLGWAVLVAAVWALDRGIHLV